jgi:hypothetical protein
MLVSLGEDRERGMEGGKEMRDVQPHDQGRFWGLRHALRRSCWALRRGS